MHSSSDNRVRDVVKNRLKESVPSANLEVESFEEQTLLLMTSEPTLAGFGFGSKKEDYRLAYEAFKRLYAARRPKWAGLDVSFSFCYPPKSISDDAFAPSVETDVFFCRKFALELSEADTSALSRLPFLPLIAVEEGGARPPSAQTLLRRSGVSSDLARALVVPGNRSAQRIVEDRLGAEIDEIDSSALTDEFRIVEQSTEEFISLLSIKITNFRAYREPVTFEFGESVTVLYGPNGFGKTSIFDALDFVATGGIGRLKIEHNSAGLQKAAKHLDSGENPAEVELRFRRGTGEHTLIRTLARPSVATLDGRDNTSRKEVLTLLTGSEESPMADRVDNLVSLFRATHAFNQESSELTQGFAQSCQLSSDLVSRMLAFDDYVRAIKKVEEVTRTLDQRIRGATREVEKCQQRLGSLTDDIQRVEGLTEFDGDPEHLTSELARVAEEINRLNPHADTANYASDADPRSLRSDADGLIRSLEIRISRLNEASSLMGRRELARANLNSLLERARELDAAQADLTEKKRQSEIRYNQAAATAQSVRGEESRLRERIDNLRSFAQRAAFRASDLSRLESLGEEATSVKTQVDEILARKADRSEHERKLRDYESALAKSIIALRARLSEINGLRDSLQGYELLKQRISELSELERAVSVEGMAIVNQIDSNATALDLARQDQATAQAKLDAIERDRSEVSTLLEALRSHIKDEKCLLCGVKHSSAEELRQRVNATLEDDDGIQAFNDELNLCRGKVEALMREDALAKARQSVLRARLAEARSEKLYTEAQLAEIRAKFSDAGVGDSLSEIEKVATDVGVRVEAEIQRHAVAVFDTQNFQRDAELLEAEFKSAMRELKRVNTELAVARAADRNFNSIAEAVEIASNTTQIEVEGLIAEDLVRLSAATLEAERVAGELVKIKNDRDDADTGLAELQKALGRASSDTALFRSQLSSIEAEILSADLRLDSPYEEISQEIDRVVTAIASLQKARDRVAVLERAMESLATSAVLESAQNERRRVVDMLESLDLDIRRSEELRAYFSELARMLENRRNHATREFTDQYGPRTAVIQRRLRPVYGFGDISVTSRNGAITVEVMRNGERHKPTEYFSQSQVQTLLLGLFLTAAGSQSWSACASILMDDPVSHFDDLNTYALVDLLAGLASSATDARQFIISTCDEKLMQISQHKFQHLGEKSRIYRFQSLGKSGPQVSEIGKFDSSARLSS
ncbi:AAA family ATPase [Pseudoxanthomonas composti]|uniref:Rad50/SbcC-type AAA domain-containing protein n=1 Tax=Pseudoxanthomonas composti TaxID=2137479 RepID=A0A4Q1JT33_9GAMM|nr:AAA family ATPase [Pseudoxanthomonas composti]RXR03476.1 hypothetical protein EPA99_13670 [Pseudoxanthomonas composti]